MTTEIYSCRPGQALKEGKLDYSSDITEREQAEADAKRRCQKDPGLAKIAYYKVAADGDFKIFYSYTNPNCKPAAPKGDTAKPAAKKKKKPEPPPGLLTRLKKSLGL
jgi:hypothetical protein